MKGRSTITYFIMYSKCVCFVSCLVPLHGYQCRLSVQHNGGVFPGIIYTVDPMLLPSGNPFECHEEILYLQPMIPPKRFDIFPLTGGRSEGLDAFRFSFEQQSESIEVALDMG